MMEREKATDKFLMEYLEKNLAKGYKLDDLRFLLIKEGYLRIDVDKAVKIIEEKVKRDKEEREKQVQIARTQQVMEVIEEPNKKGFFSRIFGLD